MFNQSKFDEKKFKQYVREMSGEELVGALNGFYKLHFCVDKGQADVIAKLSVDIVRGEQRRRAQFAAEVNEIIDTRKTKK